MRNKGLLLIRAGGLRLCGYARSGRLRGIAAVFQKDGVGPLAFDDGANAGRRSVPFPKCPLGADPGHRCGFPFGCAGQASGKKALHGPLQRADVFPCAAAMRRIFGSKPPQKRRRRCTWIGRHIKRQKRRKSSCAFACCRGRVTFLLCRSKSQWRRTSAARCPPRTGRCYG